MEIERKFLVNEMPQNLTEYPVSHIEQGYLSVDPILRVRREGDQYLFTYKGPGLLCREEHEFPLTPEAYRRLVAKVDGNLIVKDRYRFPYGTYTIELDVFAPPLAPLVMAEVEFLSEAEAKAFVSPAWFGREVTYAPAYTNAALSQGEL